MSATEKKGHFNWGTTTFNRNYVYSKFENVPTVNSPNNSKKTTQKVEFWGVSQNSVPPHCGVQISKANFPKGKVTWGNQV